MKNRRKFIKSTSLLVASAGLMGYHLAHSESRIISTNKKKGKAMLQHNVYFWLKDEVSVTEREGFAKGIKDFVSAVKEVHKAEIGVPAKTEARDVVDHSFGYSLFTWFKTMEDHNIYQTHPAHKKFIDDFSGLWAKVQVFDSELI
jgi:hypothetical protein